MFSPNPSRVASDSYDNTVGVWDVQMGQCEHTLEGHSGEVYSVVFSPRHHSNMSFGMLGMSDDWVTLSSQRILWLPPEYRPGTWANYGDTIVIGSGTGRVTFVHRIATRSSNISHFAAIIKVGSRVRATHVVECQFRFVRVDDRNSQNYRKKRSTRHAILR
jgi:hypothetical protein